MLIVEVNPNLPRTHTLAPEFDNTIPLDIIDVLVEADGSVAFTHPLYAHTLHAQDLDAGS